MHVTMYEIALVDILTLFPLWYFDLVFAHGGGGKISEP